jgi:transposase
MQYLNDTELSSREGTRSQTSVVIDREIGDWHRFHNRRQVASYTGLCPGEYQFAIGLRV